MRFRCRSQGFGAADAIGFTATPYRGRKGEELSLWQRLIFRYGPREALHHVILGLHFRLRLRRLFDRRR